MVDELWYGQITPKHVPIFQRSVSAKNLGIVSRDV